MDQEDISESHQPQEAVEDATHHNEMIPPFLPDQKVFTCNLEQKSPKRGNDEPVTPQNDSITTPVRYFEAVIRQVRHHPNLTTDERGDSNKWSFLIHFKGWNNRYDRWVSASQLVHDTPEYRQIYEQQQQKEESKRQAEMEAQRQKQLHKQQQKQKKKQAAQAKKVAAAQQEDDDMYGAMLPFTLKVILVEEREKIKRLGYDAPYGYDNEMQLLQSATKVNKDTAATHNNIVSKAKGPPRSVHALPASVSIRQFLKHFEKKTRKQWLQKQEKEQQKAVAADQESSPRESDQEQQETQKLAAAANQFKQEIRQCCKGLARLFEEALPLCLLYPQERPQYQYYSQQQEQQQQSVLDIYGCEFLLRLLIRLPQLMAVGGKSPPSLVNDMIVLLQQNRLACFKGKFRPPMYPHEWLEWEKQYYGDPNKRQEQADTKTAAMPEHDKEASDSESSDDEDLFS